MLPARNSLLLALAATALLLAVSPESKAQAKPALVRDVSTATPVNGYCQQSAISTPGWAKCALYTVPIGKRLVVEVVSYKIALDPTLQVTQLMFGQDACPGCSNMLFGSNVRQINPIQIFSTGFRSYAGSEMTRIYLEENASFAAIAYFQSGGPNYVQEFNFSGYVVDK